MRDDHQSAAINISLNSLDGWIDGWMDDWWEREKLSMCVYLIVYHMLYVAAHYFEWATNSPCCYCVYTLSSLRSTQLWSGRDQAAPRAPPPPPPPPQGSVSKYRANKKCLSLRWWKLLITFITLCKFYQPHRYGLIPPILPYKQKLFTANYWFDLKYIQKHTLWNPQIDYAVNQDLLDEWIKNTSKLYSIEIAF